MKINRSAFIFFLFFLLLLSCTGKKKQHSQAADVTKYTPLDSIVNSPEDTVFEIIPEEPLLLSARNEAFDDFIYLFATDTLFQLQRISFPLLTKEYKQSGKIERSGWLHDVLFVDANYYTVLSDSENELEITYEDTLSLAQIEWIDIKARLMKQYQFKRTNGRWNLVSLSFQPLSGKYLTSFVDFYEQFVTDSLFQVAHISSPLAFVTTDPDDDFSVIETTLDVAQWFAFKPTLPEDYITNIVYGKAKKKESPYKIMQFKGVGNDLVFTLFFKHLPAGWKLYKFEDASN